MTFIQARYYGPAFRTPQPRQIVIHSAETPMTPGIAAALARGWWQNPANQTSAHMMADPAGVVGMVHIDQRAWHCGNGNSTSLGAENAGRAQWTTAQWLAGGGEESLRASAKWVAAQCRTLAIPPRWLSLVQLARDEKGLCTHNDMRLVRGGTTHSDPGPGFPYALYLGWVQAEAARLAVGTTTPQEDDVQDVDIERIIEGTAERVVAKLLAAPMTVKTYSLRPPEERKQTLGKTITDGYAYASGAAYNAGMAWAAAERASTTPPPNPPEDCAPKENTP